MLCSYLIECSKTGVVAIYSSQEKYIRLTKLICKVIAAVVVGGTSLSGREGSILGTVIRVFIMGF